MTLKSACFSILIAALNICFRLSEKKKTDGILSLGDGASDIAAVTKQRPQFMAYLVHGNCDTHSAAPAVLRKTIAGKKFFTAHGHTFHVKTDPTFGNCAAPQWRSTPMWLCLATPIPHLRIEASAWRF